MKHDYREKSSRLFRLQGKERHTVRDEGVDGTWKPVLRNSKYSGVVESERKRSRATVQTVEVRRTRSWPTHTPHFIDSFTIPSRPFRAASWRVNASLCVVIIYSIRVRKTAPRSHRVINRGKHYWQSWASPRNVQPLCVPHCVWDYFVPAEY